MKTINGQMPAAPVDCYWDDRGVPLQGSQTGNRSGFATGLTKREMFAAVAMQGYLANPTFQFAAARRQEITTDSVRFADALLEALERDQ